MIPGEDEKSGIVLAHAARIPFVGFITFLFLNSGFLVFVGFFLLKCRDAAGTEAF